MAIKQNPAPTKSSLDLLVESAIKLAEYYGLTLDEHHSDRQESRTRRYEAHGLAILYEESRIRAGTLGTLSITVTLGDAVVLDAYFVLTDDSRKMIVPAYAPGAWEKDLCSAA